jgi:hypothetical protein
VLVSGKGVAPCAFLGLGAAPVLSGAGADKIALNIGQAAEYGQHQPPGAGAGVGPRLGQGSELRLGVRDALDDGEQVKGAAREAVNPPVIRCFAEIRENSDPITQSEILTNAQTILTAIVFDLNPLVDDRVSPAPPRISLSKIVTFDA